MTSVEDHLAAIASQGYSLIKHVITPQKADEIAAALLNLEDTLEIKPYDNVFEGSKTVRIYNLLIHGTLFEDFPVHERVLPIVEGVLDRECLVSSLSSISIGPDETLQPLHGDDQVIGLPRQETPLVCNTMWALTDFTEENGATRIVPGSHKEPTYPDYLNQDDIETIPAEMSKGDVLIWNGALWHGGGANETNERRVGVAMNYCAGFIRQQENQQLGIPFEHAKTFCPRLQELIGYGTYRNLIGHINRQSPMGLFGPHEHKTVWDLADPS
jgi:ectoine hydroxylase-related dioxygenase (phytanoyl-CoA dioxygenase family)